MPRRSPLRPSALTRWAALALLGAAPLLGACASPPPPAPRAAVVPTPLQRFEGAVQLPNGVALRYSAIVTPDPLLPGSYLGTIDIPQQTLAGASLSQVRYQPRQHLELQLDAPGTPRWVGHYNADGTIECRFYQAEESLPCTLHEVTTRPPQPAVPPLARQTPLPPFPYRVSAVKVDNGAAHVVLAGTLSVPNEPGSHAAVLLVGDAPVRDRDGTEGIHRPYLVLADHLTRAGIAVLRLDDRGVGGSSGGQPEPSSVELESDVRAALLFLRSRSQIDFRRVGVIAHGSGSPIAARVVASDQGVRSLVLLAPATESDAAYPALSCPVLALTGERDGALPTALERALVRSPAAVVASLPGLDHQLRSTDADTRTADSIAPVALERISSWLAETLRR